MTYAELTAKFRTELEKVFRDKIESAEGRKTTFSLEAANAIKSIATSLGVSMTRKDATNSKFTLSLDLFKSIEASPKTPDIYTCITAINNLSPIQKTDAHASFVNPVITGLKTLVSKRAEFQIDAIIATMAAEIAALELAVATNTTPSLTASSPLSLSSSVSSDRLSETAVAKALAEESAAQQAAELANLRQQLEQTQAQVIALESQRKDSEQRYQTQGAELASAQLSLVELNGKVTHFQTALASTELQLQLQLSQSKQVSASSGDFQASLQRASQSLITVEAERGRVEANLQETKEKLAKKERELTAALFDKDALERQKQDLQSTFDHQLRTLQQEVETLRRNQQSTQSASEQQSTTLQQEITRLNRELNTLKTQRVEEEAGDTASIHSHQTHRTTKTAYPNGTQRLRAGSGSDVSRYPLQEDDRLSTYSRLTSSFVKPPTMPHSTEPESQEEQRKALGAIVTPIRLAAIDALLELYKNESSIPSKEILENCIAHALIVRQEPLSSLVSKTPFIDSGFDFQTLVQEEGQLPGRFRSKDLVSLSKFVDCRTARYLPQTSSFQKFTLAVTDAMLAQAAILEKAAKSSQSSTPSLTRAPSR